MREAFAQRGFTRLFTGLTTSMFGDSVNGMYIDRVRRKPLLVWGNVISALMVLPLLLVPMRATSGSSTPSRSSTASPLSSCQPGSTGS